MVGVYHDLFLLLLGIGFFTFLAKVDNFAIIVLFINL